MHWKYQREAKILKEFDINGNQSFELVTESTKSNDFLNIKSRFCMTFEFKWDTTYELSTKILLQHEGGGQRDVEIKIQWQTPGVAGIDSDDRSYVLDVDTWTTLSFSFNPAEFTELQQSNGEYNVEWIAVFIVTFETFEVLLQLYYGHSFIFLSCYRIQNNSMMKFLWKSGSRASFFCTYVWNRLNRVTREILDMLFKISQDL